MESYVITGGTRGIGFGLARELLIRGQMVTICGRSKHAVEQAVAVLASAADANRVHGLACDVTNHQQVQALWNAAMTRFGRVDVWINNAGVATHAAEQQTAKADPQELANTVDVNLKGTLFGCRVALAEMLQQGNGRVYNMEGLGSDGSRQQMITGLSGYGATKCAVRYLTTALAREHSGDPVQVGSLSPGMVVTDLLLSPYEGQPERLEKVKRVFNILADKEETVTAFLADGLVQGRLKIHWLTPSRIILRFLLSPFSKRDLFTEDQGGSGGVHREEGTDRAPDP